MDIPIEPEGAVSPYFRIGEEITEELDYMPGYFLVHRYILYKYARPAQDGVVVAPAPLRVIPKGILWPMLLFNILIKRFVDHLPLYRQRMMFLRSGMETDDETIGGWGRYSIQFLEVIYSRIRDDLIADDYLMADESTIRVLNRKKKGETHLGYYGTYLDPVRRCVLFKQEEGRAGKYVRTNLVSFKSMCGRTPMPAMTTCPGSTIESGCWAAGRMYFANSRMPCFWRRNRPAGSRSKSSCHMPSSATPG